MEVEIGFVNLETTFKIGESLFSAVFSFPPSGNTCLPHAWRRDVSYDDCLEVAVTLGSAISVAVAGTVLGNANDPGIVDENTARTVPPVIPDKRDDNSAATIGL